MLELERLIDAAVGEAPAADIDRVDRIVTRRRQRRVLSRTAVVGALIVAGGALLLVPRDGPRTLIATEGTAATTPSSTAAIIDFSTGDLQRGLEALGHTVRVRAPTPGGSHFGVDGVNLCVDKVHVVQVYAYASDATRTTWSRAISRDGGSIRRGNVVTEILWIGPPHFFARGNVIALYIGADSRLVTDLTSILGTTIDPNAPHAGKSSEQHC
jgi:hypothetical protein